MSLVGRPALNHPQQVDARGARPDVDDRATLPEVFADFNQRIGPFTLDVAAAHHNTKCERYFTVDDDGLSMSWNGQGVWCNPPYSDIRPWVEKAWTETPTCPVIAMLLPANRTDQGWWHDLVEPYRDRPGSPLSVEFLRGRLRFLKHGQRVIGADERPLFGCCLLVWRTTQPSIEHAHQPRLGSDS